MMMMMVVVVVVSIPQGLKIKIGFERKCNAQKVILEYSCVLKWILMILLLLFCY